MELLSKDMAKIFEQSTRTRNVDSAEVQEDLAGLRKLAGTLLAYEQLGRPEDMDVSSLKVGYILLDRPTGELVAKGTRTQNRANRFRKAANIVGLEDKVHYTIGRSDPPNDVLKKRMEMTEEQLAGLTPPHNMAPWGWVQVTFSEAGHAELATWGTSQEQVADLVAAEVEEYQAKHVAPPNGEVHEDQEPAAAGGRAKR